MKIFIKNAMPGAWEHINLGYQNAFEYLGFEYKYYNDIREIADQTDFYLFANDSDLLDDSVLKIFKKV